MARPTKAQQAAIAQRRTDAIRLRIAGVEFLEIGRRLHADPAANSSGAAYPMGYGIERYEAGKPPHDDARLIRRVCQDVQITLESRRTGEREAVSDMRTLENDRLDAYQLAVHRLAVGGGPDKLAPDLGAMDRALKVMERRARLNGLDAPVELTGPGGNALIVEIDSRLLPPRMDDDDATPTAETA